MAKQPVFPFLRPPSYSSIDERRGSEISTNSIILQQIKPLPDGRENGEVPRQDDIEDPKSHIKPVEMALTNVRYALRFFGFIPMFHPQDTAKSSIKKHISFLHCALGALLIAGTWLVSVFQLKETIREIIYAQEINALQTLQVLIQLLPVGINIRAAMVLTIFMVKRGKWFALLENLSSHLRLFLAPVDMPVHITRWRTRAWFWTAGTVLIVIFYECLGWAATFQANPGLKWTTTHSLNSIPVRAELWQGAVVWVFFDTLPFILSQQVYISFMILTMIVADGLKRTNLIVEQESKKMKDVKVDPSSGDMVLSEKSEVTSRRKQLERAVELHDDAVQMCEQLSDEYGWIFFFAHCLDLGCALGGMAQMIAPRKLTSLQWANAAVRTATFLGYCTLMQLPQIRVNLQAVDLVDNLCMYMGDALPVLQTSQGYRLWVVIQIFFTKVKEQAAVINGGQVISATRRLFITTVTLGFSFAVLAHEVFGKVEEEDGKNSTAHHNGTNTGILTGTSFADSSGNI